MLDSREVLTPSVSMPCENYTVVVRAGSSQMNTFRFALAIIPFPASPEESVRLAEQAIVEASMERARLVCFPECFIPGYRGMGKTVSPPDAAFLERAWSTIAAAAAKATLAVVLGTER